MTHGRRRREASPARADTRSMARTGGQALGVETAQSPPSALTRFRDLNARRMARLLQALPQRQRDFVQVLPLLFHARLTALPGEEGGPCPRGILHYNPDSLALAVAQRLAGTRELGAVAAPGRDLLGVYCIGSTATVAQSARSDLDIWLCHRAGLAQAALQALQAKAGRISRWAARLGLETHFFLLSPEHFRAGRACPLSEESSGSSQHYLLLDEFYRSALVLAGAYPAWFHHGPEEAPPEAPRSEVDFGQLLRIPEEEFFGASVWQLCKGLRSPHKSLLKLLLMEAYAAEFPNFEPLSLQFKRAVCAGETRLERLDPYLLLYARVEAYLRECGDSERLALARECFYLKLDEALSRPARAGAPAWRRRILQELTRGWGWTPAYTAVLDAGHGRDLRASCERGRALVSALTASYRRISGLARQKAAHSRITQQDLNTLGHRLYAAFERRPGKLERLNTGPAEAPRQAAVTLMPLRPGGQGAGWLLFEGGVGPERMGELSPLRRAAHPVQLLAWCHFNGLLGPDSTLEFPLPGSAFTPVEAHQVLSALQQVFPVGERAEADARALQRPASPRRCLLLVNCGVAPRAGPLLTSGREDPLSYGGQRELLVRQLDLVLETSWGELYSFHYADGEALTACLREWLGRLPPETGPPPLPVVRCTNPVYGPAIERRLLEVFAQAAGSLAAPADPRAGQVATRHYVLALGGGYGLLSRDGAQPPASAALADRGALLRRLGRPRQGVEALHLDPGSAGLEVLRALYADAEPGRVEVYAQAHSHRHGGGELYVVDELGALFHQRVDSADWQACLVHLDRFLIAVAGRHGGPRRPHRFHTLQPDGRGGWRTVYTGEHVTDPSAGFCALRVAADSRPGGGVALTLVCEGRAYSSVRLGGRLFAAVAADILARRHSGLRYPVYITELRLSAALNAGRAPAQSCLLLQFKRRIESRLSDALRALPDPA